MHMIIINYKSTKMNTKTNSSKNAKGFKTVTKSKKYIFLDLMIKWFQIWKMSEKVDGHG
jgi:hypothetical protein